MQSIIEVSEIPTITQLYEADRLRWKNSECLPLQARPEYNDKVGFILGDITKLRVDAIVNAAKPSLRSGGHLDRAIQLAAGPNLRKECKALDFCLAGDAKRTRGYNLPAKRVIQTVGPVFGNHGCRESCGYLRNCYLNSLRLAVERGWKTIAFPALGAGIYEFPLDLAASVAVEAVRDFIISPAARNIDMVIFCIYNEKNFVFYEKNIPCWFPPVNWRERYQAEISEELLSAGRAGETSNNKKSVPDTEGEK